MTTIKLKNGSGAPLAGNLVQGEPALDLTNKRLYTEDSSGTVIEVGTNPGEDVTFADNRKAIFGAGSDLQIYHDGSNSYIQENGTGDLLVGATNFQLKSGDYGESMLTATDDGAVTLFYNNASKLATQNTGIDVTGSVTADGLTVDGLTQLNTNNLSNGLTISGNDNANVKVRFDNTGASGGDFVIQGGIAGASNQGLSIRDLDNSAQRIHINSGGDISFYEDTGTTAKLFWDSSAESLGIGTSTPSAALDVSYGDYQNSGAIKIGADLGQNTSRTDASRKFGAITAAHFDNDEADLGLITIDSSSASVSALTIGGGSSSFSSASTINFQTSSDGSSAGTNAMTIDASGNLLVGVTSAQDFTSTTTSGHTLYGGTANVALHSRSGANALAVQRTTNDGALINFFKDTTAVGSIGAFVGYSYIGNSGTQSNGMIFTPTSIEPFNSSTATSDKDGDIDLGASNQRFKDLYLSGGVYLGGTASANLLDDYEEGTWTPVLSGSSYSFGTHTGTYVKVGKVVTVSALLNITAVGSDTSNLSISGYPFTADVTTNHFQVGVVRQTSTTGVFYLCQINVASTIGGLNSMDGVTSGSNKIFTTGNYGLSLTYIASS